MPISRLLLTNEVVLRFLSEPPPQSSTNPLLHCCLVLSDELCWRGRDYAQIHWYIDNCKEEPSQTWQWWHDVSHCDSVSLCGAGGNRQQFKFLSIILRLLFTRVIKSEDSSQKKRAAEYDIPTIDGVDITPWLDSLLTAHCDIEYSEILPRPPAKHHHTHATVIHLGWGVTSSDIYK